MLLQRNDRGRGRVLDFDPSLMTQAFFTKHAFRPTAMLSTLQEISWSPSTRRMGFDFEPPLSTCEPPSFKSLIRITQSPSVRMFPCASLTTRGLEEASGAARRSH